MQPVSRCRSASSHKISASLTVPYSDIFVSLSATSSTFGQCVISWVSIYIISISLHAFFYRVCIIEFCVLLNFNQIFLLAKWFWDQQATVYAELQRPYDRICWNSRSSQRFRSRSRQTYVSRFFGATMVSLRVMLQI